MKWKEFKDFNVLSIVKVCKEGGVACKFGYLIKCFGCDFNFLDFNGSNKRRVIHWAIKVVYCSKRPPKWTATKEGDFFLEAWKVWVGGTWALEGASFNFYSSQTKHLTT